VLTCVSIVGRSLVFAGLGPIPGYFELVELGIAFAVFSFFPWCQYSEGHARVDLFKRFFSRTVGWASDILSNLLMLAVSLLIGWCLYLGMLDKFEYTETTFILQLPLGWGYAVGLVGALAFVLVTASCLLRTLALKRPKVRKPPFP
jgi:TRAP-type C4-dicarboxylate transport system permease small subunit